MAMPEGAKSVIVKYDVNRLSPNQRIFWAERSKRTKVAKSLAEYAWRTQGRPGFNAPCNYRIVIFRGRRIDQDNAVASCKAILDGLFHGNMLPDDSDNYAKLHGLEQVTGKTWERCEAVQVTVWKIDEWTLGAK